MTPAPATAPLLVTVTEELIREGHLSYVPGLRLLSRAQVEAYARGES